MNRQHFKAAEGTAYLHQHCPCCLHRVETKAHGSNGNGSSDNKHGNGNSATKNGTHHGSNGNGASTTLIPERPRSCGLAGTAEGKVKRVEAAHAEDHKPIKATARSAFGQYTGPPGSSRKRSASGMAQQATSAQELQPESLQQQASDGGRSKSVIHRERNLVGTRLAVGACSSRHCLLLQQFCAAWSAISSLTCNLTCDNSTFVNAGKTATHLHLSTAYMSITSAAQDA